MYFLWQIIISKHQKHLIMKKLIMILLTLYAVQLNAQEVIGDWNGVLSYQGTELRVVFHVTNQNDEYQSTMDSPDQGASGIPTDITTFKDGKLTIMSTQLQMEYIAVLDENGNLKGTFNQGGVSIPLVMTK